MTPGRRPNGQKIVVAPISFLSQGKAAIAGRYGSLKNRGYDHHLSDRYFRGKTLAAKLQEVVICNNTFVLCIVLDCIVS